ncbi:MULTISPECIES: hypothetical protein [Myxococcus]|uniref:hypothetical protein n=1 Tax=Myxococcus TaxID=32 RepID=UPI001144CC21|nr:MULTISPECIES: hypothetical protein [Myxococcus]NOK06212.1 hypothetical protein [Myxococcus xanthus]
MSTACITRAPLLAVTVPQPLARSVELGTAPVLNLAVPPAATVVGAHVAVCAGEYDAGIAQWMDVYGGIRPFSPEDVPSNAVLAVGRVASVSYEDQAPRESRWYVGPVGLWLMDVVRLPELVPCEPGQVGHCWELPADVLAAVHAGYATVQAADAARWAEYHARGEKALVREPAPGLRAKCIRKCSCRRAMEPCPTCKVFRCTAPGCPPHTCAQKAGRP